MLVGSVGMLVGVVVSGLGEKDSVAGCSWCHCEGCAMGQSPTNLAIAP